MSRRPDLLRRALTFGVMAIFGLIMCAFTRCTSMSITQEGGDPVFHFRNRGINGFLDLLAEPGHDAGLDDAGLREIAANDAGEIGDNGVAFQFQGVCAHGFL